MAHERAKAIAKRRYGGACVFTGLSGVDGCHIFPAGDYPEYADNPDNVVPAVRWCHRVFDKRGDVVRPVSEKLYILLHWTRPEVRPQIRTQLAALANAVKTFPEPQRPDNEIILRNSENNSWTGAVHTDRSSAFSEVQADL